MILNHPIILATAACVLLQLCAFFYQLKTKHADSVDMAWAWGYSHCGDYLSAHLNRRYQQSFDGDDFPDHLVWPTWLASGGTL